MKVVLILGLFVALVCGSPHRKLQPHILLMLVDDWGWGDVSFRNYSDMYTPNIERLKNDSLQLMSFYTQPKCTPARAALMTARYPYKMGLQTSEVFTRRRANYLDLNYKLLPGYLKDLGYRTHIVGKWHLGHCNLNATPTHRGFESHFGTWGNVDDRFNHTAGKYVDWTYNNQPYYDGDGIYTAHLIANRTQQVLWDHFTACCKREPLFLYVPFLVPHLPTQAPESYITDTICDKIPKLIEVDGKNVSNKRRYYCGMVAAMDEAIGNITNTLKELGVYDQFIVLLTSDNGGAIDAGASNYPLRGNKQTVYEGGTRVRTFLRAPYLLKRPVGEYHELIHITDILPTFLHAAGGDLSVLPGDIDGIDVWDALRNDQPSPRQWMVYNLDSDRELAAIRFKNATHDFKLIYSNDSKDSEVGYRYPDPRPKDEQKAHPRRRRYPRIGAYHLYNLADNPNEVPPKQNSDYKDMVKFMRKELKHRFEEEMPIIKYKNITGGGQHNNRAWIAAGC